MTDLSSANSFFININLWRRKIEDDKILSIFLEFSFNCLS